MQKLGVGGAPRTGRERASQPAPSESPDAWLTLEEMERGYIERVLKHCEGRIEGDDGAARLLGLAPSTLRSRMTKLGVKR